MKFESQLTSDLLLSSECFGISVSIGVAGSGVMAVFYIIKLVSKIRHGRKILNAYQ